MAQNLTQHSSSEDEIDIREIVKLILDSKKILISTILVFTISSVIYSLSLKPEFNSSTILEIGYSEMPNGTQRLIEKHSDVISNLNLYQFLNSQDNNQVASFKAIENKLILIETSSGLAQQNENLLVEIIRYIDERHSNLALLTNNQKKDEISRQIEMIESELSFIRAKESNKSQLEQLEIEYRLAKLKNELPAIDLEISQLDQIILDDTNNLSLLKENENLLKERAANSPTLEQIIFNYKAQINALNSKKSTYILEIRSLNNQLKTLENDKSQSDQLFRLEQEKVSLENDLQVLMNQTQVNTRLIGNIKTNTVKPKTLLITSLGIIIGFITGIFLVFISNFLKRIREVEA